MSDGPACTEMVAGSQLFAPGSVPSRAVTVGVEGPVNGTGASRGGYQRVT